MEMKCVQGALQHPFDMSFFCLARKRGVVLEILSSLQQKMCKVDFFVSLDIWQGLAEGQEGRL